jgi:hypothetical protein
MHTSPAGMTFGVVLRDEAGMTLNGALCRTLLFAKI